MACGNVAIDESSVLATPGVRTVRVEPRVALDGLVELGARADSIVVDQVLFHAPSVEQTAGGDVVADILASDPTNAGPLLFRYDAASSDAFGDVLGGEREWNIDGTGALDFAFQHFDLDVPHRQKLEEDTGVDLAELSGHTAVVHGFMLTSGEGGDGKSSGFSSPCEGDPDGNPASCRDHTKDDGDPDGNPADGDPDGNPAKTHGDGDPDGNPAHPEQQDGDPDGNPSQDTGSSASGKHVDHALAATGGGVVGVHEQGSFVPVPFFLVLDEAFDLSVPLSSVFSGKVDANEVVPIDLHVALNQLLTDDLLHALDEQASDGKAGAIVVRVAHTSAAAFTINVQADGVKRVRQTVTTSGIRVTGDRR